MIILKNGLIYDGSTNKAKTGNVVIDKDKIVKITDKDIIDEKAEVIDCTGLCIAPGFIDAHSHNDFFAGQDDNLRYFEPFIKQGVTTMVTGNCGFSAAGYLPNTEYNNQIGGGLFDNYSNDFSSFKGWEELVNAKSPVNIVSLVGHGTIRISLNSKNSSKLNDIQLKEMEEIIDRTLSEGAAGVSLGLMYEPSQFAPLEELLMIARVVKKHNKVLSIHARALSKVSTSYTPPIGGRAHNLRAIDEVLEIARSTGVKIQFSHLIFVGEKTWSSVDEALALLDNAVKEGIDIKFDMYAMEFGASILTVVLPIWYLSLSDNDKAKLFTKLRLAIEIAITTKALGFNFNDIMISNTKGKMPEIEGKTIKEIAKEWKMAERKAYLKIVKDTNAVADVLMYKYANQEIIEKLRVHPLSLYMTDAWVTDQGIQNFAIYYNFPKFILLAKNSKSSIEQAINKMSGAVADQYQMKDRGYIKEGNQADITIFNMDKLNYSEGKEESPSGIEYVIINGKKVINNGRFNAKVAKDAGEFIKV